MQVQFEADIMVMRAWLPLDHVTRVPQFEVQQLLDDRYTDREREFFVRWHGFSEEHDTWEPEAAMTLCKELYNAQHPARAVPVFETTSLLSEDDDHKAEAGQVAGQQLVNLAAATEWSAQVPWEVEAVWATRIAKVQSSANDIDL